MYEKIIIFIILFCCFSCQSTKLYNNGTGASEYREIQSEIRDGETELAITGENLKFRSEQIEERIENIESIGKQLEQSIETSAANEQELRDILQSIRERVSK